MTDVTAPANRSVDVATDAAKARIRARYRAETRFRFYGLAAIGVTGLFLAVVLTDIFLKGMPAFTQYSLVMQVKVDPAEIDPRGTRDPAVIRAADFQLLVRDALRAEFPNVTGRSDRRTLDGLLSSGASDLLRERVVADPSLVGQTLTVPALLSDDADLYLKGIGTRITRLTGRGKATVSGTEGEITILSTADDFAARTAEVKQLLSIQARAERQDAERFKRYAAQAAAKKADLEKTLATQTGNNRAAVEAAIKAAGDEADSFAQRAKQFEDDAAALQARFDNRSGSEVLTENLPSLLIAINGGLVKAVEIDNAGIKGQVLLPLQTAAEAQPGSWQLVTYATPESNRRVGDREVAWLERLREKGVVHRRQPRAGTGGHSRRADRIGADAVRYARDLRALGRRRRHLSGGVRSEEPPDRPDRGQHQ